MWNREKPDFKKACHKSGRPFPTKGSGQDHGEGSTGTDHPQHPGNLRQATPPETSEPSDTGTRAGGRPGPAAPRPVRAGERSRAARLSEETPAAAAGPSAGPRGRHTPAPGGADGPRVRTGEETRTDLRGGNSSPTHRGSGSPAHRPSPQRRGRTAPTCS